MTPTMSSTSNKRFLLLDERNGENVHNVALKLGTPTKHHANPLMIEDKPWERRYDNFYGNVVFDEEEALYKCWYNPLVVAHSAQGMSLSRRKKSPYEGHESQEMGICYASSKDGLRWEKPSLGLIEFEKSFDNNLILRGPHGAGIFKDSREEEKSHLYKSIWQGLNTSFSQDGFAWSLPRPISRNKIAGDTHNNALWAPTLGKYVGFTRTWGETDRKLIGPPTKTNHAWGRQVARIESIDFCDWSKSEVVIDCANWEHQPYAMPVFFHANTYIGLLAIHDQISDRVWTELAWSPDTKIWHRINEGVPLINACPDPLGYDFGCIYACASPIFLKEEIRVYYGGSDWLHTGWRNGCLALATLRPDGFAGYEQINGNELGRISTKPLNYGGEAIKVSADVSKNGWIKACLRDNSNSVISSTQISKTSTDSNLFDRQVIGEDTVRIEFELNAAKLYSFSLSSE